jgi:hypothetical protein
MRAMSVEHPPAPTTTTTERSSSFVDYLARFFDTLYSLPGLPPDPPNRVSDHPLSSEEERIARVIAVQTRRTP